MQINLKKISDEWERTLMWSIIAVLFLFLCYMGYTMIADGSGSSQKIADSKTPFSFFSKSLAFMTPPDISGDINPLIFSKAAPMLNQPRPNNPQQNNPNSGKNNNGGSKNPGGKKQNQTQPPKNTTPTTTPTRKISVQYRGFLKGTENSIAFYSAIDSKDNANESKSVQQGTLIHGLIEIVDFDAEQMTVRHDGKEVSISKSKKQEFIIQ